MGDTPTSGVVGDIILGCEDATKPSDAAKLTLGANTKAEAERQRVCISRYFRVSLNPTLSFTPHICIYIALKITMKWPWASRKQQIDDNLPSSKSDSTTAAAPKSQKVFPSGIKLLHDGEDSVVE